MSEDKLILVHYIDTGNMINTEIPTFIEKVIKETTPNKDEHLSYFIPIKGESRVECINPKLVGKDEYKIHLKRLEKAEKEFYKVIDEIKTKQR